MLGARGLLGWMMRIGIAVALAAAGVLGSSRANAQPALPGLVGQLAATDGTVWLFDREPGDWRSSRQEPLVNWPLTSGDRLRTDSGARAVLRVASVTVRLDGDSELELARVEAGQLVFRLWRGRAAWHVLDDTQAGWLTLLADPAKVLPQRAGHYRLDQGVGELRITTWRGEARVLPDDGEFSVKAGRQASLVVDGPGGHWRMRQQASAGDAFAEWVLRDARDDAAPQTARQLGDTLSGFQSLERHGRWREDRDWGWIWVPTDIRPGWQPYRDGRWVWVTAWGWTWVDFAPWGFVTVHYGRWIPWRGGWAWQPGPRHERPIFTPVPPVLTPPPPPPHRRDPGPRAGDRPADRPWERPGTPDRPPYRPIQPGQPGLPAHPGQPGQPGHPGHPAMPGVPAAPVTPVVPPVQPAPPVPRPMPLPPPAGSAPGHSPGLPPVVVPVRPPVTETPDKPIPRVPGFSRPRPPEAPVPRTEGPRTDGPRPAAPSPAVPPPAAPRPEPAARPEMPRPAPNAKPEQPRPVVAPRTEPRDPGREAREARERRDRESAR